MGHYASEMGYDGYNDAVVTVGAVAESPLMEARKRIDDLRAQAKRRLDSARKQCEVAHLERERTEAEVNALNAAAEALAPQVAKARLKAD